MSLNVNVEHCGASVNEIAMHRGSNAVVFLF